MTAQGRDTQPSQRTASQSARASGHAQIFQAEGDIYVETGASDRSASLADSVSDTPIADLNAYDLGVHLASLPPGSRQAGHALDLTPYLERPHDSVLRKAISQAAAGGSSVLALLVGDSTIGKTRALYEALNDHEDVRLWPMLRPANAEELNALIIEGRITAGKVLWLNETQRFLYGATGDKSASGLSRILESTHQVIILGALWHIYLDDLIDGGKPGDPTAGARELLDGPRTFRVSVPSRMSVDEKRALVALSTEDSRLTIAAATSGEEGQVIQHLTGGPELLDAYLNGGLFNPVEHALITAALEARRLGHNAPLSAPLLAMAADGYLTRRQRPGNANWANVALTDITTGVRSEDGTRSDVRKTLTALTTIRVHAGEADPAFEPNDFLDQNTRYQRRMQLGTVNLWDALVEYATDPDDLNRLGRAAHSRGLYRHATALWVRAVAGGQSLAAAPLLRAIARADNGLDSETADWIVERADPTDPRGMDALIRTLHRHGLTDALENTVARVTEETSLDNLAYVANLLSTLSHTGNADAANALAMRVARNASLESSRHVANLLKTLFALEASQAAEILISRVAHDAPIESPNAAFLLLKAIAVISGQAEAIEILADRVARSAPLNSSRSVAHMIRGLRKISASKALVKLLARNPAIRVPLDSPRGVGSLITEFRKLRVNLTADELADRAARSCPLNDPQSVAYLVRIFGRLDTQEPLNILTDRIMTLNPSQDIAALARSMRQTGIENTLTVIAILAVTSGAPSVTSYIIRALRALNETETILAIARMASERAPVDDPRAVAALINTFYQYQLSAPAATLAARLSDVSVKNPRSVAYLIRALLLVEKNSDAADALALRASEHTSLENPRALAELLDTMYRANFHHAIAKLLARNPVQHVSLGPGTGNYLFRTLREVGASDMAKNFLRQAANSGSDESLFHEFIEATATPSEARLFYRFGREPDEKPSRPWTWHNLL